MKCPKCESVLIVDFWCGWIWYCFNCDYEGRKATEKEIEQQENEMYVAEND